MIELYGMASPNVLKVLLMLEELELPHVVRRVDIWCEEQFSDAFRALNPNSKVPVLVDPDGPGGEPITLIESNAILLYLAETRGRFLPVEPRARAEVQQWLMLQTASIGPMFGQSNHFRRAAPAGNEYSTARFVTEAKRLYDVVETRLAGNAWLGGADYSIADMAAWPWLSMFHEGNGADLAALPAVARWLDAVGARPATQRAMAFWPELEAHANERRAATNPEMMDRLFGRGKYVRA